MTTKKKEISPADFNIIYRWYRTTPECGLYMSLTSAIYNERLNPFSPLNQLELEAFDDDDEVIVCNAINDRIDEEIKFEYMEEIRRTNPYAKCWVPGSFRSYTTGDSLEPPENVPQTVEYNEGKLTKPALKKK